MQTCMHTYTYYIYAHRHTFRMYTTIYIYIHRGMLRMMRQALEGM